MVVGKHADLCGAEVDVGSRLHRARVRAEVHALKENQICNRNHIAEKVLRSRRRGFFCFTGARQDEVCACSFLVSMTGCSIRSNDCRRMLHPDSPTTSDKDKDSPCTMIDRTCSDSRVYEAYEHLAMHASGRFRSAQHAWNFSSGVAGSGLS